MYIVNVGKTPLRLKQYTYCGTKYSNLNSLVYKTSTRWIELPTLINNVPFNGISHVSIILEFDDSRSAKKYIKEIEVDFKGTWVVKELPLEVSSK